MNYLIYRQLVLPFGEWVAKIQAARNEYARKNGLGGDDTTFDWKDIRISW